MYLELGDLVRHSGRELQRGKLLMLLCVFVDLLGGACNEYLPGAQSYLPANVPFLLGLLQFSRECLLQLIDLTSKLLDLINKNKST